MKSKQNTPNNSISLFLVIVILYFIFNIIFFSMNYFIFKNLFPNNFNNFYNKIQNYSLPGIILSGSIGTLLITEPTIRFSLNEINKSKFEKLIIPLFVFPIFYFFDYQFNIGFPVFQTLWIILNLFYSSNILNSEDKNFGLLESNSFFKNKYIIFYSILTILLNTGILSILFKEKLEGFNIAWIFILSIITFVHSQFLFYIKNKFANSSIFIILFLIISFIIPMFLSLYK